MELTVLSPRTVGTLMDRGHTVIHRTIQLRLYVYCIKLHRLLVITKPITADEL